MPRRRKTSKPSRGSLIFEAWKKTAQAHVDKLQLVGGDNVWDEADSYDLARAAETAFAAGVNPRAFIEEQFAEDIASRMHDDELAREAEEDGDI